MESDRKARKKVRIIVPGRYFKAQGACWSLLRIESNHVPTTLAKFHCAMACMKIPCYRDLTTSNPRRGDYSVRTGSIG